MTISLRGARAPDPALEALAAARRRPEALTRDVAQLVADVDSPPRAVTVSPDPRVGPTLGGAAPGSIGRVTDSRGGARMGMSYEAKMRQRMNVAADRRHRAMPQAGPVTVTSKETGEVLRVEPPQQRTIAGDRVDAAGRTELARVAARGRRAKHAGSRGGKRGA